MAGYVLNRNKQTDAELQTAAGKALAPAANASNFLYNMAENNMGVGMDEVVQAGRYANLLQTQANQGYAPASVAGERGTAAIEAKPQVDVTPSGGGGGGSGYRSGGGYSAPGYTAATLPSATSQEAYINAMYDASLQRKKAALEEEYAANVGALDRQAATIPGQYQAAVDQAAAQAAINRAAFNERAAAAGLSTGAAGQAALANQNALMGSVSDIRRAQSDAMNDVEKQRMDLQTAYQKAIAEAVANNEADRAAALYNEAVRVDESIVATAANQAAENYRAWMAAYK